MMVPGLREVNDLLSEFLFGVRCPMALRIARYPLRLGDIYGEAIN